MTYLASTANSGVASHDAIPCGWDCGNGYAKLHSPDGEILMQSYFYQIDDHDCGNYEALGNGSVIEYLSGDRLDLIGTRWLIGETAEIYHPLNYQRIVDDFKHKVNYGLQMLLGAIALMPKQNNYHLTVVASLHDSQAFAADLRKALQGSHRVKLNGTSCTVTLFVQVTEEGIGALILNRVPGQRKVALIDLGHGTTIAGKETGGLAATFKEGINFIGCTTQAIAVGALRRMNVASGAYFKANPNNFGEPIKGGELGSVPEWLKGELHPGNGQPDPVRSLLKIFPELQQEHKAASLPENEKLGDMDDVSRLEFISQLQPEKPESKEKEQSSNLSGNAFLILSWLLKNREGQWVKYKGKEGRDSAFINFLSASKVSSEERDEAMLELFVNEKIEVSDDDKEVKAM